MYRPGLSKNTTLLEHYRLALYYRFPKETSWKKILDILPSSLEVLKKPKDSEELAHDLEQLLETSV